MIILSIIIPAYNAEKYIVDSILSILNSHKKNIEIIVVNDGSSDNTVDIVNSLKQCDSKITLINQENNGPGLARNAGLNAAIGNYIMFLDADDRVYTDEFIRLFDYIEVQEIDVICFGYKMIGSSNEVLGTHCYNFKKYGSPLKDYIKNCDFKDVVWNKIYKNKFLKSNKIVFESFKVKEDSFFLFKVFSRASSVCTINLVVYEHRSNNPNSLSNKFNFVMLNSAIDSLVYQYQASTELNLNFVLKLIFIKNIFYQFWYSIFFTICKCDNFSKIDLDDIKSYLIKSNSLLFFVPLKYISLLFIIIIFNNKFTLKNIKLSLCKLNLFKH